MGRAGVTLLEMLVVLAILGILAAIGITSYLRWSQRARADAAVAEVQRIVTQAKARVRTTNRDVTLSLDTATHTFTLAQAPGYSAVYPVDAGTLSLCQRTVAGSTETCTATTAVTLKAPYGTLGRDLLFRIGTPTVNRDAYLLGPTALLKVVTP